METRTGEEGTETPDASGALSPNLVSGTGATGALVGHVHLWWAAISRGADPGRPSFFVYAGITPDAGASLRVQARP